MSRVRAPNRRRITLLTCMLLIAVLGLLLGVTRTWGKDEWLVALLILTLSGAYLGIELIFEIVK